MSKLSTWFRTKLFLHDMVSRYAAENQALEAENSKLRKKLGAKDNVLQRALDDHAQSNSFHQAVITNMQKRINELVEQVNDLKRNDISYKLPNGITIFAELIANTPYISIDIKAKLPNGSSSCIVGAEWNNEDDPNNIVRIFPYAVDDEEPTDIIPFDTDYFLKECSPETEQDYIDQVMQDQADRADNSFTRIS